MAENAGQSGIGAESVSIDYHGRLRQRAALEVISRITGLTIEQLQQLQSSPSNG